MESVLRQFFNSPTVWTLNITQAMFIWAAFLGSSYAFQEHGHVAVDLVRDLVDKHTKNPKRTPRRVMAVIGYIAAFVVIICMLWGGWIKTADAINMHQMRTLCLIPKVVSTCRGNRFHTVLATLIFMILEPLAGGDKYL